MKKRMLALLLTIAMLLSFATPVMAADTFSDIDGHWGKDVVEKWAAHEVIHGYTDGTFAPDRDITRGELALVLSRVMRYKSAAENTFSDLDETMWYAEAILQATRAGLLKGDTSGTVRPTDKVSREEAMLIMARVLNLNTQSDFEAPDIADWDEVSDWAAGAVYAMYNAGYIKGDDAGVRPTDFIKRIEILTILDNMFSALYDVAGVYSEDSGSNVIISVPDVTLENMTISGDLVIAQGVGDGDVTLSNVKVLGNLIVRGGGKNSVRIIGGSEVNGAVRLERYDGGVRVVTEDGTVLEAVYIDDGSDDVVLEGNFTEVSVDSSDISLVINGNVESLVLTENAAGSTVDVGADSTVGRVETSANDVSLGGEGKVTEVLVNAGEGVKVDIVDANVTVGEGAGEVNVNGEVVTPPAAEPETEPEEEEDSGLPPLPHNPGSSSPSYSLSVNPATATFAQSGDPIETALTGMTADNGHYYDAAGADSATKNANTAAAWAAINTAPEITIGYSLSNVNVNVVLAFKYVGSGTVSLLAYDDPGQPTTDVVGDIWDVLANKGFADASLSTALASYNGYWGPPAGRNVSGSYTYNGPNKFRVYSDGAASGTITVALINTADGSVLGTAKTITIATLPPQTGAPAFTGGTPATVDTQLTVGAGSLGTQTNLTYTWYRSADNTYQVGDTQVATGTTYTPVAADVGNYLIVVATTPDATGSGSVVTAIVLDSAQNLARAKIVGALSAVTLSTSTGVGNTPGYGFIDTGLTTLNTITEADMQDALGIVSVTAAELAVFKSIITATKETSWTAALEAEFALVRGAGRINVTPTKEYRVLYADNSTSAPHFYTQIDGVALGDAQTENNIAITVTKTTLGAASQYQGGGSIGGNGTRVLAGGWDPADWQTTDFTGIDRATSFRHTVDSSSSPAIFYIANHSGEGVSYKETYGVENKVPVLRMYATVGFSNGSTVVSLASTAEQYYVALYFNDQSEITGYSLVTITVTVQ